MYLKKLLAIALLLFALFACQQSASIEEERNYIGTYRDYNFKYPNCIYLDFTDIDVIKSYNLLNDTVIPYDVFKDSLIINDSIALGIQYENEALIIGERARGAGFYKPVEHNTLIKGGRTEIRKRLIKTTWERSFKKERELLTFKEIYQFEEDKVLIEYQYFLEGDLVQTEQEYFEYYIANIKDFYFLIVKDEEGRGIICGQIIKSNKSNFEVYQGKSDDDLVLNLQPSKEEIKAHDSIYKRCSPYRPYQYYYRDRYGNRGAGARYKYPNAHILKETQAYMSKQGQWEAENGYVRIRFLINCEGETAFWSIQTTDRNFKAKQFPKAMVKSLLDFTVSLDEWMPNTVDGISEIDDYRFITFKIENGEVVEIIP